jgi:hypothetical protein
MHVDEPWKGENPEPCRIDNLKIAQDEYNNPCHWIKHPNETDQIGQGEQVRKEEKAHRIWEHILFLKGAQVTMNGNPRKDD